ncbi:hypothetical protein PENTCL1PPCAC_29520, partial [Pristionchus entomophagus]
AVQSLNGKPVFEIFAIVAILAIGIVIAVYCLTTSYPPSIHVSLSLMLTCILILLLTEILDRLRLYLAPFNYALRTFFFALICGIVVILVLLFNAKDMGRDLISVS